MATQADDDATSLMLNQEGYGGGADPTKELQEKLSRLENETQLLQQSMLAATQNVVKLDTRTPVRDLNNTTKSSQIASNQNNNNNLSTSRKYQALVKQHSELQGQFEQKCSQLNVL